MWMVQMLGIWDSNRNGVQSCNNLDCILFSERVELAAATLSLASKFKFQARTIDVSREVVTE